MGKNKAKAKATKTVMNLTEIQQKFRMMLSKKRVREVLVKYGYLSEYYLKTTKTNELFEIPVTCYSNILFRMLNDSNEEFRTVLSVNGITPVNLLLLTKEVSKLNPSYIEGDKNNGRYIYENTGKVMLVERGGNYSPSMMKSIFLGYNVNVFEVASK